MIPSEEEVALEQQLIDGINSGPGIEANDAYWERKLSELVRRASQEGEDQ